MQLPEEEALPSYRQAGAGGLKCDRRDDDGRPRYGDGFLTRAGGWDNQNSGDVRPQADPAATILGPRPGGNSDLD
jgi:hypothetical protein